MTGESHGARTPIGVMWVDEGVLWHRIDERGAITAEHATAVRDTIVELTGGTPMPAVVDIRAVTYANPEARGGFAGPPSEFGETATAILVGSEATRVMASMFVTQSNPQRPVAVFDSEDEARAWALGHVT